MKCFELQGAKKPLEAPKFEVRFRPKQLIADEQVLYMVCNYDYSMNVMNKHIVVYDISNAQKIVW